MSEPHEEIRQIRAPGRKAWRLSEQDIAQGRILHGQGVSWKRIGEALKCDAETIRRVIDPDYDKRGRGLVRVHNRKIREERALLQSMWIEPPLDDVAGRSTTDTNEATKRAIRGNERFRRAMLLALHSKKERCPVGVDTRPSSPDGRFRPARYIPQFSSTGSPAGMCADLSDDPLSDGRT